MKDWVQLLYNNRYNVVCHCNVFYLVTANLEGGNSSSFLFPNSLHYDPNLPLYQQVIMLDS